jgi:exopolysaccharide production protein ExoY
MPKPTDSQAHANGEFLVQPLFARDREHIPHAAAKRGFDLIVASLILLIVAPVMAWIWFMVRLDGGRGLYGHPRIGQGNRMFRCLKFRTMVVDSGAVLENLLANDPQARAEWESSRKLLKDPRVTSIGRILRATSLDELPQLFNVLRGEMSLVGPRPVVRDEIDKFYHDADRSAYFSVRPGLTGLWQVSGRSDASYDQRVRLDREYVHNASFKLDMLILFKTVGVVLGRRGAY